MHIDDFEAWKQEFQGMFTEAELDELEAEWEADAGARSAARWALIETGTVAPMPNDKVWKVKQ